MNKGACVYLCVYVYLRAQTYVCICMYVYTHVRTYILMHVHVWYVWIDAHVHMGCSHVPVGKHVHRHTFIGASHQVHTSGPSFVVIHSTLACSGASWSTDM